MIPERLLLICFLAFLKTTKTNVATEAEDFKPEDHVRHTADEPPTQIHEDGRCRCLCPNPAVANGTHSERKVYIRSVLPSECNCVKVVLAQMGNGIEPGTPKFAQMQDQFCHRCACKYETRNTGKIKVVVIIVIVVIVTISVYGLFLALLDPWLKRKKNRYAEHSNEEISLQRSPFLPRDSDDYDDSAEQVSFKRPTSMLDRVGQQQSKWQRNVQQQRRNIYDRRTMLN